MAETFAISRAHLMYGVCLPIAVLVGYFLASPQDSDSLAVLILILSVLSVPVLMKWNFPLLILSWNAPLYFPFLPGSLTFCNIMVAISLSFALLNRSLGKSKGYFFEARSVARSLIFLGIVVLATAYLTGGIGVRALGSDSFGGKKYFYILLGISGFFALAAHRVTKTQAMLFAYLFFLSGVVIFIGYLVPPLAPGADFIHSLLPVEQTEDQPLGTSVTIARMGNLNNATLAIFCFLLMRYGIRGVFDLLKPWRMGALLLVVAVSLLGGFRSIIVLYSLIIASLFYLENLIRSRYFVSAVVAAGMLGIILIPQVQKLPLSVQRTLSFLPIAVDPTARSDAEASTQWRLDMWKQLLPEVPKHLIKGKGYALNPDEMFGIYQSGLRGFGESADFARYAGDYHSGPFSLIIPFGLFGVAAFVWFVAASIRLLHNNLKHGDPDFKRVNTFIMAVFLARVAFFVFVFGSISTDLITLTGLVGLSVSLNGAKTSAEEDPAEASAPALLQESYSRRRQIAA